MCWLTASVVVLGGNQPAPDATVEGTVRMTGKTLDNCLVQFLPIADKGASTLHSSAVTDAAGHFALRLPGQRVGACIGRHRVVVQDLSVSNGRPRVDHGTAEAEQPLPPTPVRASRVPGKYNSVTATPLQLEVRPGHQTIELDLRP